MKTDYITSAIHRLNMHTVTIVVFYYAYITNPQRIYVIQTSVLFIIASLAMGQLCIT